MAKYGRVLLISTDTTRSDCIGRNPNKASIGRFGLDHLPRTPTFDSLCDEGTFFTNCYSAAPYTPAAHASMLTGLWPMNHGIHGHFFKPLHSHVKTLFTLFKRAGYTTVMATDFGTLLGPILGFTTDVDHYFDCDDAGLLALLDDVAERPVFCFWHFATPHLPYGLDSLEADGERFVEETRYVLRLAGLDDRLKEHGEDDWLMETNRSKEERSLRLSYYEGIDSLYGQAKYDALMDLYVRGVEFFDQNRFARSIADLKRRGWFDRTLIAVTGDHGEEYSPQCRDHFDSVWNGVTNVPLIFIGPGIPTGRIDNELVRSIDLTPTLLDLAGIADGSRCHLDGVSLGPRIEQRLPLGLLAVCDAWFGDLAKAREHLNECSRVGHWLEIPPAIADRHLLYVRDGRWKYQVHRDLIANWDQEFLFDGASDVAEMNNVMARYPHAADSLRLELAPFLGRVAAPAPSTASRPVVTEIAAELMDMGYLRTRQ